MVLKITNKQKKSIILYEPIQFGLALLS